MISKWHRSLPANRHLRYVYDGENLRLNVILFKLCYLCLQRVQLSSDVRVLFFKTLDAAFQWRTIFHRPIECFFFDQLFSFHLESYKHHHILTGDCCAKNSNYSSQTRIRPRHRRQEPCGNGRDRKFSRWTIHTVTIWSQLPTSMMNVWRLHVTVSILVETFKVPHVWYVNHPSIDWFSSWITFILYTSQY